MTTNSTKTFYPETAAAVLVSVVEACRTQQSQRPSGSAVTAALLELEKTVKQTRQSIPLEWLLGTWQLCFSAGKKAKYLSGQPVGSGFYVPRIAIAQISFTPDATNPSRLTVANKLRVGPLHIRFTGPARYPGQKNLLAFDFTHLTVRGFGLPLYQGDIAVKKYQEQSFEEMKIAKLPFFAFFAATADYIAARGRGGGLAIWVRSTVSGDF